MDLLIENGALLTLVEGEPLAPDPGYVSIRGDRIAAVGKGSAPAELRENATLIDASHMAVLPGLVNAHTHLFQTFIRGLADDKTLLPWLKAAIWPVGSTMSAHEAYLAAMLGLVENIRSGATTVIDNQYLHCDSGSDAAFCRAGIDVGCRLMVARGWADHDYHPAFQETPEQIIDALTALHAQWHGAGEGRIRIASGPLIPWGCSESALQQTAELARSWGSPIHIHTAETREEVQMSLDATGLRHVQWLDRIGVLGPDVHLVHAVWLDDAELDLVAEKDAVIVHCPVSNMYLASGIARIIEMRKRGITVALATDGPGSNNSQDMLETLKFTACLQKVGTLDPTALLPRDVLEMACINGARAFNGGERGRHELGDERGRHELSESARNLRRDEDAIGSIRGNSGHSWQKSSPSGRLEVGAKADVILVDLDSPRMQPVWRPDSALVYNANGGDVDTVIVDGRVLMRSKRVTCVDEKALLAECRAAAQRLIARAGVAV